MDLRIALRVKNDLAEALSVSEVNENHASVVSSGLYPAHERNGAVNVFFPKLSAEIRSFPLSHKF